MKKPSDIFAETHHDVATDGHTRARTLRAWGPLGLLAAICVGVCILIVRGCARIP